MAGSALPVTDLDQGETEPPSLSAPCSVAWCPSLVRAGRPNVRNGLTLRSPLSTCNARCPGCLATISRRAALPGSFFFYLIPPQTPGVHRVSLSMNNQRVLGAWTCKTVLENSSSVFRGGFLFKPLHSWQPWERSTQGMGLFSLACFTQIPRADFAIS